MKVSRTIFAIITLIAMLAIVVGCAITDDPADLPDGVPSDGTPNESDDDQNEELQHQHEYSIEWSYDETYHWHVATCEHTDEISSKSAHLINIVTNVCAECGYQKIDETPENPETPEIPELPVAKKFNLTLLNDNPNGGTCSNCTDMRVTFEQDVLLTAIPNYGYDFIGWFDSDTGEFVGNETNCVFTMPARDVSLTAKWKLQSFTVKLYTTINLVFDLDWDEGLKEFGVGEIVSITITPQREEYIFCGWYDLDTNTLLSTSYHYSFAMPNHNINLYMKWEWFTVKAHNTDENAGRIAGPYAGNEIGDFERVVAVGKTVRLFAYPNDGYEFVGWFDENDELVSVGKNYQFVMENKNVSLVAKWIFVGGTRTLEVNCEQGGKVYSPNKSVTVSFDLNGASGFCPSPITVTKDKSLKYPNLIPTGGGVFRGWYVDRECTELFDFSAPLTRDVKLYAGWAPYAGRDGVKYSMSTLKIWQYNSEETCYNSRPDEIRTDFYYFATLTEGQCTFYFKNESATDFTRLVLHNITQGVTVLSRDIANTEYQSVTFYANAGDAFYISTCRGTDCEGSVCNFYMTGAALPKDGGTVSKVLLDEKIDVVSGETVALIAEADEGYVFDGWYDEEGNLVSDNTTFIFTMPYSNVVYTARWRYVG